MRAFTKARVAATIVAVAVTAILLPTASAIGQANAAEVSILPETDTLPEPFSDWNVSVHPEGDNPQVLTLEFDSPLAGRRMTNTVFVPDSYRPTGAPSAVLYSLHGTVFPQLNSATLDPVTSHEVLLKVTRAAGGYRQTQLSAYDSQLRNADFLVVAPDTTLGKPWCETCVWVDGREDLVPNASPATAQTRQGDAFLHEELFPLVEALFNVRSDRGGRGVTGFSMGAWAALLQAAHHPDKYAFVAAVSTVYDLFGDPALEAFLNAGGYLRDQGYGTSVTHRVWWEYFNPASVITNTSGADQKIMISGGDACLGAEAAAGEDCQKHPAATNPLATTIEVLASRQLEIARRDLPAKGVAAQIIQTPGVHGANNHVIYSEHIVPEANRLFSRPVSDPERFSYRTVEENFSVWGYDVSIERPNDEFFALSDAKPDAGEFGLAGTGEVSIRTPAAFVPGSVHTVTVTPDNGATRSTTLRADEHGRLHLVVQLGEAGVLDEGAVSELLAVPSRTATVRIS